MQILIRKHQDNAKIFFDKEYPGLYRYALYLTRDPETAQDLCQEAFIRWFNLPDPVGVDNPAAWLKKVLSNLAMNHFRHQKVRSKWEVDCADDRLEGYASMENDLTRMEVEDALAKLSDKDQMLIKMRVSGMPYKEIAEALHVSIGSVGTMLARAMARFKVAYVGKEVEDNHELSRTRQDTVVPRRRTGA